MSKRVIRDEGSKGGSTSIGAGTLLAILLTVAFVVLKLCGVISWSWFWVFSPIIFCVAFGLLVTVIVLVGIFIISTILKK